MVLDAFQRHVYGEVMKCVFLRLYTESEFVKYVFIETFLLLQNSILLLVRVLNCSKNKLIDFKIGVKTIIIRLK